jgi:2-isopropylmalate synthase
MQLVDYKVRVLDNGVGTGARVRVLIESTDGQRRWGTVGLSANVVEASWQALLDSVEYKLHKDNVKARPRPALNGNGARTVARSRRSSASATVSGKA